MDQSKILWVIQLEAPQNIPSFIGTSRKLFLQHHIFAGSVKLGAALFDIDQDA